MKIINSIIGSFIIIFGMFFFSITVNDELSRAMGNKLFGLLFIVIGVVYLNKMAKITFKKND